RLAEDSSFKEDLSFEKEILNLLLANNNIDFVASKQKLKFFEEQIKEYITSDVDMSQTVYPALVKRLIEVEAVKTGSSIERRKKIKINLEKFGKTGMEIIEKNKGLFEFPVEKLAVTETPTILPQVESFETSGSLTTFVRNHKNSNEQF